MNSLFYKIQLSIFYRIDLADALFQIDNYGTRTNPQ